MRGLDYEKRCEFIVLILLLLPFYLSQPDKKMDVWLQQIWVFLRNTVWQNINDVFGISNMFIYDNEGCVSDNDISRELSFLVIFLKICNTWPLVVNISKDEFHDPMLLICANNILCFQRFVLERLYKFTLHSEDPFPYARTHCSSGVYSCPGKFSKYGNIWVRFVSIEMLVIQLDSSL